MRIGEDPVNDIDEAREKNTRCNYQSQLQKSWAEASFHCPRPGIVGNIVTLASTTNWFKFGAMEVEFLDCPNGFMPINNHCFKWLTDDTISNHHIECDALRGKLLDTSPDNNIDILVAKTLMDTFSADSIFAGISKKSGTVVSYMSEELKADRDPELTNNVDTSLHEYGIVSKEPDSGGNGFLYFKSYGSNNTRHPAICKFGESLVCFVLKKIDILLNTRRWRHQVHKLGNHFRCF